MATAQASQGVDGHLPLSALPSQTYFWEVSNKHLMASAQSSQGVVGFLTLSALPSKAYFGEISQTNISRRPARPAKGWLAFSL